MGRGMSAKGRARLQHLLKEGLGDHILYLQLFQVSFLAIERSLHSIKILQRYLQEDVNNALMTNVYT